MKVRVYRSRGSALMMVLFTTVMLSSIVITSLTVIHHNIERETEYMSDIELDILAHKGLSYGSHPQILRNDPLLQFASTETNESYEVTVTSEGSKMNINGVLARADKELLRVLFVNWGLDFDSSAGLVDAMIDWVDQNDELELNGAEYLSYQELGHTDRPYNKPFTKIEDLRLVLGFDQLESLKPDWQNYFTLYGDQELDIHEADPELLSAAASIDIDQATQFIDIIKGSDEILGSEDDFRYSSLEEALTALGVSDDEEERERIGNRFRLKSGVKRVVSRARIGKMVKEITVVVRQSGQRPVILFHSEKTSVETTLK